MLLSTQGFSCSLTKLSIKGSDVPEVTLVFKYTSEGENQDFLNNMEEVLHLENIKNLFKDRVMWDKLTFKSFLNHKMTISLDELDEFDANLVSISVSKKYKNGVEIYDYMISFTKDLASDNLDKVLATEYLNRKEENERTGKKELVKYQLNLKKKSEVEEKEEVLV